MLSPDLDVRQLLVQLVEDFVEQCDKRPPHQEGNYVPFADPIGGLLWQFVDGRMTELSRHHIIPYSVLKNFFITLMKDVFVENPESIPDFWLFLGNLARFSISIRKSTLGDDGGAGDDIIDRLEKAKKLAECLESADHAALQNAIDSPNNPYGTAMYELFTLFAWLPGNVVLGPTHRSDDRGNILDEKAGFTMPESNYTALRDLYGHLQHFQQQHNHTPEFFSTIMTSLGETCESGATFYPLNPLMWSFSPKDSTDKSPNRFFATPQPRTEPTSQIDGHQTKLGSHYYIRQTLLGRFFDRVVLRNGRDVDPDIEQFGGFLKQMADHGHSILQEDGTCSYGEFRFTPRDLSAVAKAAGDLDSASIDERAFLTPYSPFSAMRLMFLALPFNIFEGPRQRFDYPQKGTDSALLSLIPLEQKKLLTALYKDINAYDTADYYEAKVRPSLGGIVETLTKLFELRQEAHGFDASKWKYAGDLQTDGESFVSKFKVEVAFDDDDCFLEET